MKPRGYIFLIPLIGLLAAGCESPAKRFDPHATAETATNFVANPDQYRIPAEWLRPPAAPFSLGPGDIIDIEVIGKGDGRMTTFVCPDGKLYYDLLPGVDVWGLSLAQTRELLQRELATYYRNPQVVITLRGVGSKRIWVLGRLNETGVFPLTQPTTIIGAISMGHGLFTSRFTGTTEELADLEHSFIIRSGRALPINFRKLLREGDMSQNIYVQPDDFIYLPSALTKEIYVLGAVIQPRPLGFMDDITLVGAIAKAQGTQPNAYLSHVAIVRGSLAEPKIAIVNYHAILLGREHDIRLEPRDIVYVPTSPAEVTTRYLNLILNTFVRTVAANEGARAASQKGTVGISVGIGQ